MDKEWFVRNYFDYSKFICNVIVTASSNLDSAPANISTGPQIDPNTPPIIEGIALSQFVAPIISSTWNQDDAYNFDCPTANGGPCNKAFTGCVATAMAQVIRRWQFPSNSNFNYSLMGDACDHTCSPNNNDLQVAYLMSFCGNKVGMSYGASSSSASTSNVPNALKNMGYSNSVSYTGNLSYYNLDNNILNNWPVIMRGDNGSASGHAWVCDGLARYNWYFGVGIGMYSWAYYHMNWGWGGYCNGWYAFGSINPNNQGTNIGLSFNQNMKAVINIHP